MDFIEDLFDRKKRHPGDRNHDHGHGYRRDDHNHYHRDDDERYSDDDRYRFERFKPIIMKILNNRPLLFACAGGILLMVLIALGLLFALLPLVGHGFEYVNKQGLKGVVDLLMPLLGQVWQGKE